MCQIIPFLAVLLLPAARPASAKAPLLSKFAFEDSLPNGLHAPLKSGDTFVIRTRWVKADTADASYSVDSMTVTPNFSLLETIPGNTGVENLGGGWYRIIHQVSATPRIDQADIRIPVTAQYKFKDHDGSPADSSVTTTNPARTLCLSNYKPRFVSSVVNPERLKPPGAAYHPLDTLSISTTWTSVEGLTLDVTADMRNICNDTTLAKPVVSKEPDNTFLITYRIPADTTRLQPNGPKVIPIRARDSGCGDTTSEAVHITLDYRPPAATGLVVDQLPAVTTSDSLLVTGEAPHDASLIYILRNLFAVATVAPDTVHDTFAGRIALDLGLNQITVRAVDSAGNTTPLSDPQDVTRVEKASLSVLTPYSRNYSGGDNDIVLRDPDGIASGTIRIFNLEGDCLWSQTPDQPGTVLEFGLHWPGTDQSHGERAPQGYYLVRAEWKNPSGRSHAQTHGLLLRD